MDSERFDRLVRSFGQTRTRRQTLRGLAGAVAAGALAVGGREASAAPCRAPKHRCGKGKNASCVNKQTDVNNCGECGNQCGSGQSCCAGKCVNKQTDVNNCGECGKSCTSGQSCENGTCTTPICPAVGNYCDDPRIECGAAEADGTYYLCLPRREGGNECGTPVRPDLVQCAECETDLDCEGKHPGVAGVFCGNLGGCNCGTDAGSCLRPYVPPAP